MNYDFWSLVFIAIVCFIFGMRCTYISLSRYISQQEYVDRGPILDSQEKQKDNKNETNT